MAVVAEVFANAPSTTVTSGGTTAPATGTQETWTVASSSGFPAASSSSTPQTQFHVADPSNAIAYELIAVTGVSGSTWTVTRGAENTTPVVHTTGFTVQQVASAGFFTSPVFSGAVSTGGLTGATAASRYAGATASGAPVSGTFALGDYVVDQAGKIWICTTAGTPGSWTAVGPTIPVTVAQGGTGVTSLTAWELIAAGTASTAAVQQIALGTTGQVLTSGGAGALPSMQALPSAGTASAGAVTFDNVTSHFQPLGTASAGGVLTTKTAYSDHAHPFQAWQFLPESYGAKGDGKLIADATISGGALSTLTSASAGFTSADTGKTILINAAGAGGGWLSATITFVNSTTVTLGTSASGGITNKGALYGTDDTAAIQSAVNAAVTYAQATVAPRSAQVVFRPVIYCIAGAASTSLQGNSQIQLPIQSATAGGKVQLGLMGTGADATGPPHWTQVNPALNGTVLACMRTDGSLSNTFGPTNIIGGPVNGYGGGLGTFSDMELYIDNVTFTASYPSSYAGPDLFGVGGAVVDSVSFLPLAVAPSSTVWPQYQNGGPATSQYTFGIRFPTTGNNDLADFGRITVHGMQFGIVGSEHCEGDSLRVLYGNAALLLQNIGSGVQHGAAIRNLSSELTSVCIQALTSGYYASGGVIPVTVQMLAIETESDILWDPGNILCGEVSFEDLLGNPGAPHYYSGLTNGGANVRLYHLAGNAGPVGSPQAPPGSGTAWANGYYRDAWITLAAGTISALSIDSTAQKGLGATTASYAFLLPSGHSYTPTYSGSLSATVTLT